MAQLVSSAAGLLTAAILARAVGADGFGVLGFGIAFLSLVSIVSSLGTDTYGMRNIAREPTAAGAIASPILGLRFSLSAVGFLAYAAIIVLLDRTESEKTVLMIQGMGLFVTAFMLDFVFQGLERMRVNGLRQIATALLTLILVYLFVTSPEDLERAAAAPVIAGAIAVASVFLFAKRSVAGIRLSFSPAAWKVILVAALPLSVTVVMQTIIINTDIVMLGLMAGNEPTGLYTGAFRIIWMTMIPAGLLITSFTPSLAAAWQDPEQRTGRSRSFALSVLLLGSPLVVFAGLFPAQILRLFYGDPFAAAGTALSLLSAGMIATYLSAVFGSPLLAWNQERFVLKVTLVGVLVNVSLNVALIPAYGMVGAAVASVISQTVIAAGYAIGFRSRTSTLHLAVLLRVAICLCFAAAGILAFSFEFGAGVGSLFLTLLINGAIFALLYLVMVMLIFRGEWRALRNFR